MNYFIVGLFLSAIFLYEMASKKSDEKTDGPFDSKDCNDTFNKLPPVQQELVRNAVKNNSKTGIKTLADSVRKDYPDMAKCLDTIVASLGVVEGLTSSPYELDKEVSMVSGPYAKDIQETYVPPSSSENAYASAQTCVKFDKDKNKIWEVNFMSPTGLKVAGKGSVTQISDKEAIMISISEKYDEKVQFAAIGSKVAFIIPSGTKDCMFALE